MFFTPEGGWYWLGDTPASLEYFFGKAQCWFLSHKYMMHHSVCPRFSVQLSQGLIHLSTSCEVLRVFNSHWALWDILRDAEHLQLPQKLMRTAAVQHFSRGLQEVKGEALERRKLYEVPSTDSILKFPPFYWRSRKPWNPKRTPRLTWILGICQKPHACILATGSPVPPF